jgi:hypothetical protein
LLEGAASNDAASGKLVNDVAMPKCAYSVRHDDGGPAATLDLQHGCDFIFRGNVK